MTLANSTVKKVVIFIPALDEEAKIGELIDRVNVLYSPANTTAKGYYIEILVVNDGSVDKTEEIARDKGAIIVSHPLNLGLGAATRTGLDTAFEMGADVAVKLDADFQHDPEDIEKVIIPLVQGKSDLCWGSRFAGKVNYRMPIVRLLGNYFFTWLMNRVTNFEISDAQTGLMAFNKKYLEVFEIRGDYNPPQQLLIDADHKRMRYMEVPVVFHQRTTGKSFVSFRYPFYVFTNIFRVLLYGNPLKVFSVTGVACIVFSFIYFLLSIFSSHFGLRTIDGFIQNLSLVSLVAGFQLFFFGILAEMLIKKRARRR